MNRHVIGSYRKTLAVGAALLATAAALASATPAMAQTETTPSQPPAEDDDTDQEQAIVVTGTLIDRPGFEAPTPTTVIGQTELRQAGRNNAADVLADIPQFRFSNNPTGNAGFDTVGSASGDLRALGFSRTLYLLNGRRFIGDFDLNSIPFAAIERIDVVTGGASATYGSDAVAGVINILLNDEMNGVEVGAQTGISTRGDGAQYRFDVTAGANFGGGRGNVLLSAEYFEDRGIPTQSARRNVGEFGLLANPTFTATNGQQPTLLLPDIGLAVFSEGGFILQCLSPGPCPGAGQQFLPNGTLAPFNRGTIVSGAFGSGGDGPRVGDTFSLRAGLQRYNLLGAVSYELTDTIRLSADVRYANVRSGANLVPDFQGQATTGILGFPLGPAALGGVGAVSTDNPFMPAAYRAQLIAAGQPLVIFGRWNRDFGIIASDVERETYQGAIALDGSLGETFRWSAYYTHGEQRRDEAFSNFVIRTNFALASDVVTSPTTGQPVCRVNADANPANDVPACVPINLFGFGAPSAAALDYVLGTSSIVNKDTLDVAAATLRGEPFSLWAGPVSIAVGAEYRRESSRGTVDALSAAKAFIFFNFNPFGPSSFSVNEAFGEIVVPLVRNVPLLRNLEFNGAVRYSDYSTSGGIWAWKLGLSNELFDGLRVRAVRSRDIRAPGIGELFGAGGAITGTIRNPFRTPNTTDVVVVRTGPNPNLVPEKADTTTAGVVFQPSFIPGLSLAADYYSIDISGAITALGGQALVNLCFDNPASPACNQITFNSSGAITEVRANLINIATFKTSGVDLELSYRMPLERLFASAPGRMTFRVLASYVDELIFDDGVVRRDTAGDVGGNIAGVPHWRGIASATYENDRFSADLRARYVGGGNFNSQPGQGVSADPVGRTTLIPDINARIYVDLNLRYGVLIGNAADERLTIFGGVVNLFDRDPPRVPNSTLYDVVGRYFTVGARARF